MFSDYIDNKKAPDISPDAFTEAFNHPHNEQLNYLTEVADLNAQSQALDACGVQPKVFDSYTQFLSCKKTGHIDSLSLSGLLAGLSSSSFIEGGSPCHVKEVCDLDLLNVLRDDYYDFSDSLSTELSVGSSDSSSLNSSVSAQAVLNNKPGCQEILYGNFKRTHDAIEVRAPSQALELFYKIGSMPKHAPFYNNFDDAHSSRHQSPFPHKVICGLSAHDSLNSHPVRNIFNSSCFDSQEEVWLEWALPLKARKGFDSTLSDLPTRFSGSAKLRPSQALPYQGFSLTLA